MNYIETRIVGRILRLLIGILLAVEFAIANPDILLGETTALVIFLAGVIVFYLLYTILIGNRVLTKVNPWIGAVIMDWPLLAIWTVVLGHLPGVPPPLILAVFLYFGISLILSSIVKYGGCEVVTIPGLILRRRYNVACIMFSPIDWLEEKLVRILKDAAKEFPKHQDSVGSPPGPVRDRADPRTGTSSVLRKIFWPSALMLGIRFETLDSRGSS